MRAARWSASASWASSISRHDQPRRRQLRSRHARRGHRRRIGSRQRRRVRGRRAGRASAGAEGARRTGPRLRQRCDSRARLRRHQPRALQPARHQPVDWRAGARVVRDATRSPWPRDARSRPAWSWSPPPATSARTCDDEIQYGGDHRAGQRAVGADGRRVQPHGHGRCRRRSRRRLQLARADGLRLRGQARPGRARHSHRLPQRRRQLPGIAQPGGSGHRHCGGRLSLPDA